MENTGENKPVEKNRKSIKVCIESAAILLQVQGPQLAQRLFSQNQTSDDLRDML